MELNQGYLDSVRRVYADLTIDELLHEYYTEFEVPQETKIAIEELFAKANITLEKAYWKHRALMEAESYLNEDKTKFPPIKVIGRDWFYQDWLTSLRLSEEMGIDTKGIETIEKYYEMRSVPMTAEQKASMEKLEDEIQTMIHYGKYKDKK
jgi:hypothetical protein